MPIYLESIQCNTEQLLLTNQRVAYWKAQNTLILSDVHIGKTAHFRKQGIPIPFKVLLRDLERLDALIQHFKPERLIVVGDLFHAEFNQDVVFFQKWMSTYQSLELVLVKGNHDGSAVKLYENLNIKVVENQLETTGFTFVHDSPVVQDNVSTFYISGHTHPGVLLKGKGKQRIKLPCYQWSTRQLVLPAFSLFTGLNTKIPSAAFKNYAFTADSIFEM